MADCDVVIVTLRCSPVALETEIHYFEQHRVEWVKHHREKFALVKGETLHGIYDTADNAYEAGVEAWGNVPFLIKQILPEDPIEQVPALVHGLIHAYSSSSLGRPNA